MKSMLFIAMFFICLAANAERRISSIVNFPVNSPTVGCPLSSTPFVNLTLSNPSSIAQTARVAFKFAASHLSPAACSFQTSYSLHPSTAAWYSTSGSTCNKVAATNEVNCPAMNILIPSGSSLVVAITAVSCDSSTTVLGAGSAIGVEITENAGYVLGSVSTSCSLVSGGQVVQTELVGGHPF